jgi:ribosomal-protein-serine acetyltransferase
MDKITNGDVELKSLNIDRYKELFNLTDKNRAFLKRTLSWLDFTNKEEDSRRFIETSLEKQNNGSGIVFEIWYKGEFVGMIDYHNLDKKNNIGRIGYWIGEEYQGHGIVTEACKLIIKYGFDKLNLNRIEIVCALHNPKSAAVAQRLGFTKEGVLRQWAFMYDHYDDMESWSLIKGEETF